MEESSAVEHGTVVPQQATITMNSEPINPQLVLLILILTCSSWYPYIKQVNIFQDDSFWVWLSAPAFYFSLWPGNSETSYYIETVNVRAIAYLKKYDERMTSQGRGHPTPLRPLSASREPFFLERRMRTTISEWYAWLNFPFRCKYITAYVIYKQKIPIQEQNRRP